MRRARSARTAPSSADRIPSLTPDCPQAHLFEREIAEQCGVVPRGHPWLKPVRRHPPDHPATTWAEQPSIRPGARTAFFRVEGEEVHEVAVGPVHAGIIEPGHFRFQSHGEQVLFLEIMLGYQHRGVERLLETRGPDAGGAGRRIDRGRHGGRACGRVLRGRSRPWPGAARRPGRRRSGASPSSSSGWPITSATSGRSPGTWLTSPRLLLRPHARRVPQPPHDDLGQPVRARAASGREESRSTSRRPWQRRHATGSSGSARSCARSPIAARAALGAGPTGGGRRASRRASALELGLRGPRRPGLRRAIATSGTTIPYGVYRFAHIPVSTAWAGDVLARVPRAVAGDPAVARVRASSSSSALPGGRSAWTCGRAAARRAGRGDEEGLARRDRARGHHRRRGRHPPLQGRGSLLPQLEWRWRWRCRETRSPTSRSATRASTCLTRGTTSDARVSAGAHAAGDADLTLPRRRRRVPRSIPRPTRCFDRSKCDGSCAGCMAGMPSAVLTRGSSGIDVDVGACSFLPRRQLPARMARSPSRRIIAWRRRTRAGLREPGRGGRARDGARGKDAPPVRAVAAVAIGRRGELQRLRGRAGGTGQRRVRHGAIRGAVRRVAPARRRPGDHGGRERQHAGRRCVATWEATPAPRLVIAVGACAINGGPFRGSPEVSDGVPIGAPGRISGIPAARPIRSPYWTACCGCSGGSKRFITDRPAGGGVWTGRSQSEDRRAPGGCRSAAQRGDASPRWRAGSPQTRGLLPPGSSLWRSRSFKS